MRRGKKNENEKVENEREKTTGRKKEEGTSTLGSVAVSVNKAEEYLTSSKEFKYTA